MSLSIVTLDLLEISDKNNFPDSDEELERFLVALGYAKRNVDLELKQRREHRIESGKADEHLPSHL